MLQAPEKRAALRLALALLSCFFISCTRDSSKAMDIYFLAADSYDSGDFANALELSMNALEHDKNFLPALVLGGKAAFFEAEPARAKACLLKARRIKPEALEPLIWLARIYRFDGEKQKAVALCEEIIANNPSCISGWRLLASLAEEDDDISSSLLYLNQAVRVAGEAGLAFLERGSIRWAIGDMAGSVSDLETAIAIFPPSSPYAHNARELLARIQESE